MLATIQSMLKRKQPQATVPQGQVVYAIGDIHGQLHLLDQLLERVVEDAAKYPEFVKTLVFLGDYVDRGPDSNGVLQRLATLSLPGITPVFLRGNHEEMLDVFLTNPARAAAWLQYGGVETLLSYGVATRTDDRPATLQELLLEALPDHHVQFIADLKLSHMVGDYMFVHAGVRPGRRLAWQDRDDMLWIREPFLSARRDHGKVVVHGHSINYEPEFFPDHQMPRRIGIDTGAYRHGVLTCLALVEGERTLIQAGSG